jgi:hypothetical protein
VFQTEWIVVKERMGLVKAFTAATLDFEPTSPLRFRVKGPFPLATPGAMTSDQFTEWIGEQMRYGFTFDPITK